MEEDKVSVVVPVFNAERYLGKCIESLLSQEYSNIEVLLVNDGSIDSSENICNKYSSKDLRVRVITHTNRGVADEIFDRESPLVYVGSKLYKMDIVRNSNIRYDENMKLFEDACFVFDYLKRCKKINFIDEKVYFYNQIMEASASRKSYIEYNKWSYLRYCKQIDLINEYKNSAKGKNIVSIELNKLFDEVCLHYINSSFSDKLIETKIQETVEIFSHIFGDVNDSVIEFVRMGDLKEIKRKYCNKYIASKTSKAHKIKRLIKHLYMESVQFLVFDIRIIERLSLLWRKYETKNKCYNAEL